MNRTDRSAKVLLTIAITLLAANLLVQLQPLSRVAMAGGIPDSGAQLQTLVDQVQSLTKTIEKIQSTLESGSLTVKVKDSKSDK